MQTTLLGRTGTRVSRLCMGTMSFGREADEAESARIYAACREAGVDFFDCANIYAGGRAEEILGRLIAPERDRIVLTSKVGMSRPGVPGGLGRRHVRESVEQSLRRLGTDRLDVLFVHRFDPDTPVEETLRTLDDLVSAGKVHHLGASNWAAWQVAGALGVSARRGWARFEVLQPMYSLVKRQAEVEILPLAAAEGLGVMPYSPVGGGLLSGKYRSRDAQGRIRENDSYVRRYGEEWMFETAARFADLAEAHGWHPVSLALAWVASHPAVTAPIIGARDVAQLRPALAALDIPMTPELRAEIAELARRPAPATDRLEELG
ncbi:aldo/keto reductase [Limibaculum sp. M0105]|uniref:Aldo/keto reductase n=1 Tax=Thermohalobaculum xanthum TaxID=2753746 RepID=A0A8J7M732_9RHOB|nr:aldo/keto reductase [Thermohalobaculum xanthum]MBK0399806.1 aldo/keto reductase [Thermohalobaculum xanthum]